MKAKFCPPPRVEYTVDVVIDPMPLDVKDWLENFVDPIQLTEVYDYSARPNYETGRLEPGFCDLISFDIVGKTYPAVRIYLVPGLVESDDFEKWRKTLEAYAAARYVHWGNLHRRTIQDEILEWKP